MEAPMTAEEAAKAAKHMPEQPERGTPIYAIGRVTPDSGIEGPEAVAWATMRALWSLRWAGGDLDEASIFKVETRKVVSESMVGVEVAVRGPFRGVANV
jgi:hypothetical protein